MGKIRKAIMAFFVTAGGAVVTTVLAQGVPADTNGWFAVIGMAISSGLAAGYAVYKIKNAPAVTPPSTDPVRRNF